MNLDGKATGRRRGKAQRGDNVRHDIAFDVVAMQVDLHGFVGTHMNYDLIVLMNGEHLGFGCRRVAVNPEFEYALFRMSVPDGRSEQRGNQQAASGEFESRTRSREWPDSRHYRPRNARIFAFTCSTACSSVRISFEGRYIAGSSHTCFKAN